MIDLEIVARHLGIEIEKDTSISDGVWVYDRYSGNSDNIKVLCQYYNDMRCEKVAIFYSGSILLKNHRLRG